MIEHNHQPERGRPLSAADVKMLDAVAAKKVTAMLKLLPFHKPTQLVDLSSVASEAGVASVHIKDESTRLGLGSFKALGGAYAVVQLVLQEVSNKLSRKVEPAELLDPAIRSLVSGLTVGCATDGNHGRSVAAGANFVGCKAKIFVHDNVNKERVDAIASFGAELIHVPGNYDDAVAEAESVCKANNWIIVSDTSWPGYERIPRLVMQGYTAMAAEVLDQVSEPPTHVFLQAGVGGFAAAVAANLTLSLARKPTFIIVEPELAACLFVSNQKRRPTKIEAHQSTVMAMLECYEPSLLAWNILSRLADAYMTVTDQDAVAAMKRLARPRGQDHAVVAGESGGVGLAGLGVILREAKICESLRLDRNSRVLLFNTEGPTAPLLYRKIMEESDDRISA